MVMAMVVAGGGSIGLGWYGTTGIPVDGGGITELGGTIETSGGGDVIITYGITGGGIIGLGGTIGILGGGGVITGIGTYGTIGGGGDGITGLGGTVGILEVVVLSLDLERMEQLVLVVGSLDLGEKLECFGGGDVITGRNVWNN
ncbi:hypothetical protein ACH5RR_022397 [Cinchona calisaya]|uniref:Uncharacterized protein n=1 Tax=Cinchona calisaya TaxID=153742 RepID=A0ABD2Z7P4_9GENT